MSNSTTSTRLRRSVAAFVAAAALVFGGSIAISPAYALGAGQIQINDADGAVGESVELLVHDVATLDDFVVTTDSAGVVNVGGLPSGDYEISPVNDVVYDTSSPTMVNIAGGLADVPVITLIQNARVYGSLPNDAGSGGTTVNLLYWDGAWISGISSTVVNDPDGNFSLPLLNGPGDYTLEFVEEDSTPYLSGFLGMQESSSLANSFVGGSVDSPVNLGDLDLLLAGTIEGTVTRPDSAPVGSIDVHALSAAEGTGTHTTVTHGDGTFRMKVHPFLGYEVWIDTSPWVTQYFDNQSSASTATIVNPGPSSVDIDFVLQTPPPSLSGILFDTLGDPALVETYLYKYDVDADQFVEVDHTSIDDTFGFSDLAYGDYRLGFFDTLNNEWIPWSYGHYTDLFANTYYGPSLGQECYVAFDIDPGYGDVGFDTELYPGAGDGSCKSPVEDGTAPGRFSGHVDDYDLGDMGEVSAYLFVDDGTGSTIVGSDVVDANGDYSIAGVDRDGQYYVQFTTENDQPWLDTWLGGFWVDAPWSEGDAFIAGSNLTAYRDSSGHDVSLLPATVFKGTVTSDGSPLPSIEVSVWEPFGASATAHTVLNGSYYVKVPVGGDYVIAVLSDWYVSQYWENAPDESSATVFPDSAQEVNTGIDFDLTTRPAIIRGQLWEMTGPGTMAPVNDIWVHLFELQGLSWVEVQVQPSSGVGYYYFEVDGSGSDYRVRFSDTSGNWLGFTEYLVSDGTSGGPFNSASTCSLEFPSPEPGDLWFGDGLLDLTDFTTCGPELPVLSGRLVETQEVSGGAPIANQLVSVTTDVCGCGGSTYSTFTDSDGYFSFNGLPDDSYSLYIDPRGHTTGSGEHSYAPFVESFTTSGSAFLGEIELTRYGNVYGNIDNWDPSMTGAVVVVFYHDLVHGWTPSSFVDTEVDSSGNFDVPGVDVDGTYALGLFMPDSAPFLDTIGGEVFNFLIPALSPTETFTGTAEEDYMSLSVTAPAAQFIQGVVSYQSYAPGPLVLVEHADIVVIAEDFSYFAIGETDVDGAYSVKVAPGLSYEVIADGGPPYLPQAWEQDINCGCDYDPVTVGNAGDPPTTGIDFHLYTEADTVVFDLYTSLFNGNDFEGVTVHVYQQVAGVWTETMASDTDPYGRMLLYGLDVDEYRVSFTDGTTALPIVDVEDTNNPGALPLDSTCYFEFDAEIGDYYEYDFHLNQTATAGVCGNPAAPPSSGGGSSVHHSSGGTTTGSTSTPTPTPTPTATTDPGDDGDGGSVPGRSTDDAAESPDVSAPGFPWLGILIVVIIVLCVGGTGFVILRRR